MTVFELESALVEFCAQNTADFRFPSNEQTVETTCPAVWSGFIPRDEVGSIIPGDITIYPAIIVNAQLGGQPSKDEGELVTVSVVIGCFDATLDQQGYRDCCNVLQRLKDRVREIDIIRDAFALRYPLNWQMNKKYGSSGSPAINSYPYFFAEMQLIFELTGMTTQFDLGAWDGDVTPGRYNTVPIPTPPPLEHAKHPVPPPIKWIEESLGSVLTGLGPGLPVLEPEVEPSYDLDALDFFDRANISKTVHKKAINNLVKALKSASVWTKMRALYPFVGGNDASHGENLKSVNYSIGWDGAIHNANGISGTTDRTNGYTNFNCDLLDVNSHAYGVYSKSSSALDGGDLTCSTPVAEWGVYVRWRDSHFYGASGSTSLFVDAVNSDAKGFYIVSRTASNLVRAFRNGVQLGLDETFASVAFPDYEFVLLRVSNSHNLALAFISDGLSDAECVSISEAVETFQIALDRNN